MICQIPFCLKLSERIVPVSDNVNLHVCNHCTLMFIASRAQFGQCCMASCPNPPHISAEVYYTRILNICEKHIGTEIGKLFAEIKEHIDLRNYNNLRQKRVVRVSADLIKTIPFVKMKYAICLHSDCRLRANWCAEDNTAPLLCCNHKPPEFKQYRKKYGLRASARLFLRFRNTDSAATRERKIKTKNRDKIHALIKKNTIAMISKLFMIPAVSEV